MNTEEHAEEHDNLWRLLGQAAAPSVSPFFSRNVVRAARESAPQRSGVLAWLRSHWAVAATGACVFAVSGIALIPRPSPQSEQIILLAQEFSTSPDYQVVSHLDELMESEKNSVWLEN